MLRRIPAVVYVVFISACLVVNLISCENEQNGQINNRAANAKRVENNRLAGSTADLVMREDIEEIFNDMDLEKYQEEDIKCPRATSPENGFLVGEDTSVGSVVYVTCNQGFWLSGPPMMACTVENGVALWTPNMERSCIKGQTFFNEDDPVDARGDNSDNLLSERRNKQTSKDLEGQGLPPFVDWDHKWIPSSHRLHQRSMDEDTEQRGLDRLIKELEDKLPPLCLTRPEVGPCDATFRRYYFDRKKMECRKFYYGGCGGNRNNFESFEDCMSICKGHSILDNLERRY